MNSSRILASLSVLVLAAGLSPQIVLAASNASEPWNGEAFTAEAPELFKVSAALATGDADVQVLLRERIHRFDTDGRSSFRHRTIYRILTPAGLEGWSSMSITWRPWHQERPAFRARVITPGGSEHWLDPATINESPAGDAAPDVLSDARVLRAPLPAVAVGALVEELIEVRDVEPLFAGGTVHDFYFAFQINVHRTRLVVDAPRSLPLRHVTRLLPEVEPRKVESEDRVRWVFESGDTGKVEPAEPLTPGHVADWPMVSFSTGESWARLARSYSELVDARIGETRLEEIVAAATRGARSRAEKIERLLAWLQSEIRYTGLEFGEAAFIPRPPTETLRHRYGDCKDKGTLLVTLLRTAGIPAHLALLKTGPGMDVEPELPGFGNFDHAIVYVPGGDPAAGEDEIWIDPTYEFAAAGELPLVDQDRLALVAGPGTLGLVTTPAATAEDNRTVENREIFLAADLGGARIVETSASWGSIGRAYRRSYEQADPEVVKAFFENYVRSTYAADGLVDWEISDPRDLRGPFRIRVEAAGARAASTTLTEAAVTIRPVYLLQRLPGFIFAKEDEEPETGSGSSEITGRTRRYDLVLSEPHVVEWNYRIVPPEGYRPISLPGPEVRRLGPAALSREVIERDDEVHLTLRFDTVQRRFTPAEYSALRHGLQELVREGSGLVLRFEQVGERLLAAGEIRQALAELDRLVARTPQRARPRVRRALALLEAGLGEAARREVRIALELEPDSGIGYQTLGWILQHDLLGRRFHPGFDHGAAVEAFRRALELDPSDERTRTNLAILLEFDSAGLRYTSGSRLGEAIVEYRVLLAGSADTGLEENLLVALARAGRFAECMELVRGLGESAKRNVYLLVALAASEGSTAALEEARRLAGKDERRQALADAGWVLAQLRHYPESADLLAAATRGAPSSTQLLASVELMRKARFHEELELDDGDPRSLVPKVLVAAVMGRGNQLRALYSRRLSEPQLDQELEGTTQVLRTLHTAARSLEVPVDTFLDLALASLRQTVDGDEAVGYRLRTRWDVNGRAFQSTFFVVAEGEGYRVAAREGLPVLGAEVLRLLEAGELDAARRWLDWARDLASVPSAEDPYAGPPFFRFWQRRSRGGPDQVRAAAASLVAEGPEAETAVPILARGRDKASSEDERRRFEIALARAFDRLGRHDELAALAEGWLAEVPDSKAAFDFLAAALRGFGQWGELAHAARRRLAHLPDDPAALHVLASVAEHRGDLVRSREIYERLVDMGEASSSVYDKLAWNAVVRGEIGERTIALAQQAVSMSSGLGNRAAMCTLASAYAVLGRNTEARGVLLEQMGRGETEPGPIDWYVLGRIAENYGATDAALEAYRRVRPPQQGEPMATSPYRLAQQRCEWLAPRPIPSASAFPRVTTRVSFFQAFIQSR